MMISSIGVQGLKHYQSNFQGGNNSQTCLGNLRLVLFKPPHYSLEFLYHSYLSFVCKQSAGFSGASDATRVSILLGLLKVHVNTFAYALLKFNSSIFCYFNMMFYALEKAFCNAIYSYITELYLRGSILFLISVQTVFLCEVPCILTHYSVMMLWFPYCS